MKFYAACLLLAFSSNLLAIDLCPEAKTTMDTSDCLISKVNKADSELEHYINVAKESHRYDPIITELIDTSQREWVKYRKSHCQAVYQMWKEGTIRLVYHPYCLLYTAKARTYDVWREFLTYQDSTPPLLPEPELLPYGKY